MTRPTAVYANVGSPDDLPRSVAICPNRKCVAFGCQMGIELYWVDAVTGGNLNRWFPLAAPSDFLYFLPQRPGVDSRNKLRLISSAAGPVVTQLLRRDSTPTTGKFFPASVAQGRRPSLTRLFFGHLPFPTDASPQSDRLASPSLEHKEELQGILRAVECDHFRGVPVSDGSHVLFTDPLNGLLCLGSDSPLGGPTKLVRKVVFVPPPHPHGKYGSPLRYAAGHALDWGLRLVATYDDGQVVLYNVPSDILRAMQKLSSVTDMWSETAGVFGQSDRLMDTQMSSHPKSTTEPNNDNGAASSSSPPRETPLNVNGAVIAKVEDDSVEDIAVQTEGGGLSVWLFYKSGRAVLHSIYTPRICHKRMRYIAENGLVHNVQQHGGLEDDESNEHGEGRGKDKDKELLTRPGHVTWAITDGASI